MYGLGWSAVVLGLASFTVADVAIAVVVVTKMKRGPESRKLTLTTIGKKIATGVGAYVGLAPCLQLVQVRW